MSLFKRKSVSENPVTAAVEIEIELQTLADQVQEVEAAIVGKELDGQDPASEHDRLDALRRQVETLELRRRSIEKQLDREAEAAVDRRVEGFPDLEQRCRKALSDVKNQIAQRIAEIQHLAAGHPDLDFLRNRTIDILKDQLRQPLNPTCEKILEQIPKCPVDDALDLHAMLNQLRTVKAIMNGGDHRRHAIYRERARLSREVRERVQERGVK